MSAAQPMSGDGIAAAELERPAHTCPVAPTAGARTTERWAGTSLIGLGLCLAAVAVLGWLVTGTIDYRISDDIVLSGTRCT